MKFMDKLKNNKAMITLNRVISYFILVIVLFFGIDICLFLTQSVVTSYQTAYYAEKISIQGGLLGRENILPGPINSQKTCNSCYTNSDISKTFGQTMENFGLTPYDWSIALIDSDGAKTWVHRNGTTVNPNQKLRFDYMSVNEIAITTKFTPKVSGFLWRGANISKQITFVSEYIER